MHEHQHRGRGGLLARGHPPAHRFGGEELRLGRRELGHLHGDRIADLPFPRRERDVLVAEGLARPHHVLPESGWVTVDLRRDGGEADALELFRRSYDRARRAALRSEAREPGNQG